MTLTAEDIPAASEVTRPVAVGGTTSHYQATVGGIPEANPVVGDVRDSSIAAEGTNTDKYAKVAVVVGECRWW